MNRNDDIQQRLDLLGCQLDTGRPLADVVMTQVRDTPIPPSRGGLAEVHNLDSGVAEYIRNMRVEQVKHILLRTAWSIREVTAYAGFRNASHFSTMFRKATGLSPRAWREEHREENSSDTEE